MKLKGLLKVALVLLAISTMFVACDTLAGGQFPEFFPTGDIIGDMCGDGADLTYDDATESYSYKFTYSKDMNAWAGKPGQINFKLRPVAGNWDNSYGATADKLTINGDKAEIALGGGNITVEGLVEGEEYVITLTAAEGKLYLTITGKLGDTPAEPEPEPEPEPETGLKLYLKPSSNWKDAGARFAAYFFGDKSKTWVGMKDDDQDGVYECIAPEGYPNVIFCRMNPSTTENNWDNKWDQTADLSVPTDENVLYIIAEGAWDGAGSWSTL